MNAQLAHRKSDAPSGVYTWTFSGAPVRIEVGLDVVAKLEKAVKRIHQTNSAFEIGGVLLGDFPSPGVIAVRDYGLVESEDFRQRYLPDEYKLEVFCSGKVSGASGGKVVGYFRTQREHSLELRDEEIEPISRYFGDPRQVVLLIRYSEEQCAAGFLFWDAGAIGPFSFLEFPLAAEILSVEARLETMVPAPVPAQVVTAAPQAMAAPQMVTAAPSRDNLAQVSAARYLKLVLALMIAMVVVAVVMAVINRPHPEPVAQPIPPPAAPGAVAAAPLELQVEAQGDGLNVRWNSESKSVTGAQKGRLTITENQTPKVVPLNFQQLTRGHVYYQPSTDRVEFQLEVDDAAGKAVAESVLALSSKAADRGQTRRRWSSRGS